MSESTPMAFVLGGGYGARLSPLTDWCCKPALPYGGIYKIIDLVLSSLLHSDVLKVVVETQYESNSLHHDIHGWYHRFGLSRERFIRYQSPRQRRENREWYRGTAEAVANELDTIRDNKPSEVFVLGGDNVYVVDFRQIMRAHEEQDAEVTVCAVRVRRDEAAGRFGVLEVDGTGRIVGFAEKPAEPKPIPGDEDYCLASMGNYLFRRDVLLEELVANANKIFVPRETIALDPSRYPAGSYTSHDFGHDILPSMLARRRLFVNDFSTNTTPGTVVPGYWRDVGTHHDYFGGNMDLLLDKPPLLPNHPGWPIKTSVENPQPVRYLGKRSIVSGNSIVAGGVTLIGASIDHSILSPGMKIDRAKVSNSILFGGQTVVGAGARIRNAILGTGVTIAPGASVGEDSDLDARLGLTVADGLTIVPDGRTVAAAP